MSSLERIYNLSKALQTTKFNQLVLFLCLTYFVLTRKVFRISKPFTLSFMFNGFSFTYSMFTNVDFASLEEMFIFEEYKLPQNFNPKIIVDLGAHTGDSVLYFRSKFPEARIIAVEPDPSTFKKLENNTSQLNNIELIQAAISNENGVIDFYSNSASSLGSSFLNRHDQEQIVKVNSLNYESLFKQCEIKYADLIKFDIEGGEERLLAKTEFKTIADFFIGEIHMDLTSLTKESVKEYFYDFQVDIDDISPSRFIVKARRKENK